MSSRKILFIVEGQNDEAKIIERTNEVYGLHQVYEIYSYNTTLHELIRKLFPNGIFDEEVDLLRLLRENESEISKRKLLSNVYTDVYLIFDFEPQHQVTRFGIMKKMLDFFNDSTANGKLYINYPMMQSYKHLKAMPDFEFKDRKVSIEECKNYKNIVKRESKYHNLNKYDYITFTSIILHNIMKMNYLIHSKYSLMTTEQLMNLEFSDLLKIEINGVEKTGNVDVINTYIMSIIEYAPKKFLERINEHKDRFLV